jgi:hypothetical protein
MKKENNKSFKDFFQKWKLLRSKRCWDLDWKSSRIYRTLLEEHFLWKVALTPIQENRSSWKNTITFSWSLFLHLFCSFGGIE